MHADLPCSTSLTAEFPIDRPRSMTDHIPCGIRDFDDQRQPRQLATTTNCSAVWKACHDRCDRCELSRSNYVTIVNATSKDAEPFMIGVLCLTKGS